MRIVHDAWQRLRLDQRRQDLRIVARSLRRAPGFTIAAVLTLALGIGAATSVFSVAYGILISPLPVRDADRLVALWAHNPTNQPEHFPLSGEEYRAFARAARSFDQVAAVDYLGALPRLMQFGDSAATVRVAMVTSDFFRVLGARPLIGRMLEPTDDLFGARLAAVLSEPFWRTAFGGDTSIVGRATTIYGRDVAVVGVIAGGLDFPRGAQMWASYPAFSPAKDTLKGFFDVVARMKRGVTTQNVESELGAFLKRADAPHSGARSLVADLLRPAVRPLGDLIVGDVRPAIRVVSGAVALLLLVTCINIANLLLVRTVARRREFAVRAALGAGRGRIAQQVLIESAVLSATGGVLGVFVAWVAVDAFVALAPTSIPRLSQIGMNGAVLAVAVLLCIGVALLFGSLPAIASSRFSLATSLRERQTGESGPTTHRTRSILVGTQVAVAVMVLVGAGVVARSLETLAHLDLGFVRDKLVIARIGVPTAFTRAQQFVEAAEALTARARAVPGVVGATAILGPPFRSAGNDLAYSLPGDARGSATNRPLVDYLGADASLFRTLEIPLRRGRTFTDDDRATSAHVAVVDELLARQAWPGQDPIGKQIGIGSDYHIVVGVVATTRYRDLLAPRATLYVPYRQSTMGPAYLAFRIGGDRAATMAAVQSAVREIDPRLRLADIAALDQRVSVTLAQPRLNALLLGGFAIAILLLTGLGLYSVAATFVRQREFEIGVRVALGAAPNQVVGLVLRQGAFVILIGAAVGVLASILGAGVLSTIVYGVSARDPVAFGLALCVIATIASLAFLIPARRASLANPSDVLRAG